MQKIKFSCGWLKTKQNIIYILYINVEKALEKPSSDPYKATIEVCFEYGAIEVLWK